MAWVIAVAMVACGGPGTGPVPVDTAEDVCTDICQRDQRCDMPPTETVDACAADCVADLTGGGIREDAVVELGACVADLACDVNGEMCFAGCEPTSAHRRYETRCREVYPTCGGTPSRVESTCSVTPIPDVNDSGILCLFTPQVMDELTACWDGTCAEIGTCFDAVLTKYNINL